MKIASFPFDLVSELACVSSTSWVSRPPTWRDVSTLRACWMCSRCVVWSGSRSFFCLADVYPPSVVGGFSFYHELSFSRSWSFFGCFCAGALGWQRDEKGGLSHKDHPDELWVTALKYYRCQPNESTGDSQNGRMGDSPHELQVPAWKQCGWLPREKAQGWWPRTAHKQNEN